MLGRRDQLAAVSSTMVLDCSFSVFFSAEWGEGWTAGQGQAAASVADRHSPMLSTDFPLISLRYLLPDHSIWMIWFVISSAGLDQSQLQDRRPSVPTITSLHISVCKPADRRNIPKLSELKGFNPILDVSQELHQDVMRCVTALLDRSCSVLNLRRLLQRPLD